MFLSAATQSAGAADAVSGGIVVALLALALVYFLVLFLRRLELVRAVTIFETGVGLVYRSGKFKRELKPGWYLLYGPSVSVVPVDLRPAVVRPEPQMLMTSDGHPVRIAAALEYRIKDPAMLVRNTGDFTGQLVTHLQLIGKDLVSSQTARELLSEQPMLANHFREKLDPLASLMGLEVLGVDFREFYVVPQDVS
jgi:regulator of protease activity HflC (stomatin/prohibitin superfamily)